MYVDEKKRQFDFVKFREVIKVMVRNLNKIIEVNFYPVEEVNLMFFYFITKTKRLSS